MLVTLGGLTLWAILDFIKILFGFFKDSHGLRVTQWCKNYTAPRIIFASSLIILSVAGAGQKLSKVKIDKNLLSKSFLEKNFFSKKIVKVPALPKKDTSHEIIKYVDDQGVSHYVDSATKVPLEYQGKAETNLKLPVITRGNFENPTD